MICEACNHEFDATGHGDSCSTCATGNCGTSVRCPSCYYEMIPAAENHWIKKLFSPSKWFGSGGKESETQAMLSELPAEIKLASMPLHAPAKIVKIQTNDKSLLQKIIAMAAFPGKEITLIQRLPSYVFQIGFSQFSIDRDLADSILVSLN